LGVTLLSSYGLLVTTGERDVKVRGTSGKSIVCQNVSEFSPGLAKEIVSVDFQAEEPVEVGGMNIFGEEVDKGSEDEEVDNGVLGSSLGSAGGHAPQLLPGSVAGGDNAVDSSVECETASEGIWGARVAVESVCNVACGVNLFRRD
jgi:hypothetical protein